MLLGARGRDRAPRASRSRARRPGRRRRALARRHGAAGRSRPGSSLPTVSATNGREGRDQWTSSGRRAGCSPVCPGGPPCGLCSAPDPGRSTGSTRRPTVMLAAAGHPSGDPRRVHRRVLGASGRSHRRREDRCRSEARSRRARAVDGRGRASVRPSSVVASPPGGSARRRGRRRPRRVRSTAARRRRPSERDQYHGPQPAPPWPPAASGRDHDGGGVASCARRAGASSASRSGSRITSSSDAKRRSEARASPCSDVTFGRSASCSAGPR